METNIAGDRAILVNAELDQIYRLLDFEGTGPSGSVTYTNANQAHTVYSAGADVEIELHQGISTTIQMAQVVIIDKATNTRLQATANRDDVLVTKQEWRDGYPLGVGQAVILADPKRIAISMHEMTTEAIDAAIGRPKPHLPTINGPLTPR